MSTPRGCVFTELGAGRWQYELEDSQGSERYVRYGPFRSFRDAEANLENNHSNPGGYSLHIHETEHRHEWIEGYIDRPAGVEVSIRIESLGPEPAFETIMAKLHKLTSLDDDIDARFFRIRPVTVTVTGTVCASCAAAKPA